MPNLSIDFCKVEFNNPLILPSGIIQEISDHKRAIDAGCGGVTLKSITIEPREGHPIPRINRYDHGIINAVGIRNPGIKKALPLVQQFIQSSPIPVIISIFANCADDFSYLTAEIVKAKPQLIELNLSCPHVSKEFGQSLSMNTKSSLRAVKAAKKESGNIPLLAKLTANIPGIGEIAKACEQGGADGITAINGVGPGMIFDINSKKFAVGNKYGGISGPGIKPIAVRCIFDIYNAVRIPIIGVGGVSSWKDVVEFMMVGATLVGIGSATYYGGMKIYDEIKKGLREYMEKNSVNNLKEIIGIAH